MADDVMALDERLARLEVTVAAGFSELGGRMGRLEGRMDRLEGSMDRLETRMDGLETRMDGLERRMDGLDGRMAGFEGRMGRLEDRTDALNVKLDVSVETLDAKLQLVLERIDAHNREMRVWTEAIVNEHRADRRLMYAMLGDHRVRIQALEHEARSSRGQGPSQEP